MSTRPNQVPRFWCIRARLFVDPQLHQPLEAVAPPVELLVCSVRGQIGSRLALEFEDIGGVGALEIDRQVRVCSSSRWTRGRYVNNC